MKRNFVKRTIALILCMCLCLGLMPVSAKASGSITEFSTFQVYQYATTNPDGDEIVGNIDLSQDLYIKCDGDGYKTGGFCLWKCSNNAVPSEDLDFETTNTDDGMYKLLSSIMISFSDGKKEVTGSEGGGLKLQYLDGPDSVFVPTGTYRFVAFLSGGGFKYSDVFTITDSNNLSATFDPIFFTDKDEHGGYIPNSGVTTLANGERSYLFMSNFAPVLTDIPVSKILLRKQDTLAEYVLWDGNTSNGTLIDKRVDGEITNNNIQILDGFTVGGSDTHYNYFSLSSLPEASYSVVAIVGEKTYIGSRLITVQNTAVPPVDSTPTIVTASMLGGTVGITYNQSLSATPASDGVITWSIIQGSLPDGLTLSGSTISGTPSSVGSFTFTVQASEAGSGTATRKYTITITSDKSSLQVKIPEAVRTDICLHVKDASGREVANDFIYAGYTTTVHPFELGSGSYTIAADTIIPGNRTISVLKGDAEQSVVITAGSNETLNLNLKDLQTNSLKPTISAEGMSNLSSLDYKLEWYYLEDGEKRIFQHNDSVISLLKCDETQYYITVVPYPVLAVTHIGSQFSFNANTESIVIELPKKPTISVSGTLSEYGRITVFRPAGDDGSYSAEDYYPRWDEDIYIYTIPNVTLGSKITFTPDNTDYAPLTYVVESVNRDLTHNFIAQPAKGIVSVKNMSDFYSVAGRSGLWNITNVTIKKDGMAVPFRILSDKAIVLEESEGLFSFSATSGGTPEYPQYVYAGNFVLDGDNCTMDLDIERRYSVNVIVKDAQQTTAVLIYDDSGNLCAKMEHFGIGCTTQNSPYLMEANYTFCTIAQGLLDKMLPEQYDTASELPIGKYFAFESAINNSVTLSAPPFENEERIINVSASTLNMNTVYENTFSMDLTVALLADADIDANTPVTIKFFTNQKGDVGELGKSLVINGIPMNFDNTKNGVLRDDGTLTLTLTASEVQQYGGFPLHISTVVERSDFTRMKADAYLIYYTSTGSESTEQIASFDQISPAITLQAPMIVNDSTFTVFGNTKRNSNVEIYVNGVLTATTTSEKRGDGLYTARITLPPDTKNGDVFALTAKANDTVSEVTTLVYDEAAASLRKVFFCYANSYDDPSPNKIVIWNNGVPTSSTYGITDYTYVWWEMEFNHAEKLATTVRLVNSTGEYEKVPNVTVTVPLATETITLLARETSYGSGVFATIPYIYPGGAGPSGTYISYCNQYEATQKVMLSDYVLSGADLLELLQQSGLIDYMGTTLDLDNFSFTIRNDQGNALPVTMMTTENQWLDEEIVKLDSLTGERWIQGRNMSMGGNEDSVLFYQEGYLPSTDGYWGVESINRYPIVDHIGEFIYVWEIYTKTERTVVTWDTLDRKKSTTVTILGGDDEAKQVDPVLSETARTGQILDVWAVFNWQFSVALDTPTDSAPFSLLSTLSETSNLPVMQAGKGGGNIFERIGKICGANDKVQEYNDKAQTAVNAFQNGVPMSSTEMRAIKDILDQNGELVRLAKTYVDSGVNPNPYQGVVDAYNAVNGKLGETFSDTVNNSFSIATNGASAIKDIAVEKVRTGVLENVAGSLGGQPSQASVLMENLRTSMLNAEKGSDRDMIPNGINWSKMPNEYAKDRDGEEKKSEYNAEESKKELEEIEKAIKEAQEGLEQLKREQENLKKLFGHKKKENDDTIRTTGNSGKNKGKNSQKMPNQKALHDPAGYIYEAVPSNRVQGATVTLYTYDNGAVLADTEALGINEMNPQVTKEDGTYQWFVPEGYWQVHVNKDGYKQINSGDSSQYGLNATNDLDLNHDGMADAHASDYWMPVLPVQLNVNIPLVSNDSPRVEGVKVTQCGVYVTFSKYMQSNLTANKFQINGFAPHTVTAQNGETDPITNKTYASIFLLETETLDGSVSIHVDKSVMAYNGKTMADDYDATVETMELEKLPTPIASPMVRSVQMNTLVSLESLKWNGVSGTNCSFDYTGADIYYTIDGSTPTISSLRYKKPIMISGTMTIKAIAVKPGMLDSEVMVANYTVWDVRDGNSVLTTYSVAVDNIENGSVEISSKIASEGDNVTVTVSPDEGYELDKLVIEDFNSKKLDITEDGEGRYTFTMPAGKVTVKVTFAEVMVPFSDVPANAYYASAVKWALRRGITAGAGNNCFAPNMSCTRAQIVTFLWRTVGSPEPDSMACFDDVPGDAYYAKAVAWATENGITAGTGNGRFSPDSTCTRAQIVTFLWRGAGSPEPEEQGKFSDVSANAYYAKAVAWATENGITAGTGNGKFSPDSTCTRAQSVTFLYHAADSIVER